eukprot:CAMPEP_0206286464 /NCGR_PEP_ID=MMETSP0106_2-20121207/614_1 /ASSEMBLY_ACC=CAM_ASM_000206 /TAXON_ID=81532 /ORGANISM="Acanthoeca-like sp., Strain 10tr" /LENGTH=142 /DNA_ID=CAMNT_0053716987 /DNA_START=563 /DNA_END=989 /DNA_ORIENTATION=+
MCGRKEHCCLKRNSPPPGLNEDRERHAPQGFGHTRYRAYQSQVTLTSAPRPRSLFTDTASPQRGADMKSGLNLFSRIVAGETDRGGRGPGRPPFLWSQSPSSSSSSRRRDRLDGTRGRSFLKGVLGSLSCPPTLLAVNPTSP